MSRSPGDPIAPRVNQEAASLMVEMSFRGTEPGRAGRVSATWAVALECSFLFSPGPGGKAAFEVPVSGRTLSPASRGVVCLGSSSC